MQYLEDIIELIEDVPEELQRRGGLVQDWERQASEHKREADRLTARLDAENNSLREDEKASIFRQIAEKLDRARDATQKKCDMSAKCHRLLQALCERVTEYSYHCKLELEVDAPGCTAAIERNFINETMMVAAAAVNSTRGPPMPTFRAPEDKSVPVRDRLASSSSISRESTPFMNGHNGLRATLPRGKRSRERSTGSSVSSSRASSVQPVDLQQTAAQLQLQQRKRKRDRDRERQLQYDQALLQAAPRPANMEVPVLKDPMSSYMRKKKEREREERKLREVHANRESRASAILAPATTGRGREASQQKAIKPEPADDGYESVPQQPPPQPVGRPRAGPGRPPGHRVTSTMVPIARREEADPRKGGQEAALVAVKEEEPTSMSDAEDDDLLKFLHDEMPGGMAEHVNLNLGLEDENLFDMASFGADLGKALEKIQTERAPSPLGQNIYGALNAPTKKSAAGSARYSNKNPSKADKKRQQTQQRQYVSFGAGESLHGRPRKLTNRAEEMLGDMERREKQRRAKEEEGAASRIGSGYGSRRESSAASFSLPEEWTTTGQEEEADNTLYCYCQQPSDGTMIGCDGDECEFKWFHMSCLRSPPVLNLDDPDCPWYCPECSRR